MPLPRNGHVGRRNQGFALMLVLLLVGVGVAATLFTFFSSTELTLESDRNTAAALAQAKQALIARAVTDDNRPGSFPCPDADGDGVADLLSGPDCPSYIGRLPWRSLRIPDLRDASGERLWYALSRPFRDDNSAQINSDTRGAITVFEADGTSQLTSEAVAVIFAPGAAFGVQVRDGANQNIAVNYLDISSGINNANPVFPSGPFIVGRVRDAGNPNYNDRVLFVTTAEFMPTVEMRVAREIRSRLQSYRANSLCACYPWADNFLGSDGISDVGVNRGRLPVTAAPENWGTGSIPALPSWVATNSWHNVIYYSVGRQSSDGGGAGCTTCVDISLTVNGNPGFDAVFFTPGTPRAGVTRPSNSLGDYLEDAQNNSGTGDVYTTPSSPALDRDRIVTF